MNRRGFMQTSAAALAAGMLSGRSQAQEAPASPSIAAPSNTATAPVKKLKVDAYSRHLQWLRSAEEVAEATIEMAYTGVDVTVRPYPGHVDPAKVATDLPPFVQTLRNHGLDVSMITSPITDADSPNAERILATAASLGITHYWWGTFRYDPAQPVAKQLDALKPRVEKLAALNEKYKVKALYHTYSMPALVGCNVWDILSVLRNFDPAYVALHWDVGHTTLTGGNGTWVNSMRAAGPYVGGVSVKEYTYQLELQTPGGGPFTGTPAELNTRRFGRPPGAPPAGGPPAGAPPARQPARAGGERLPAGAPGERTRPANERGGGGFPLPWRARAVPLGEGIDNLPLLASVLTEIQFSGPMEIQAEYPNGGAESAQDKITLPRIMVLGAMKHDLLTLKAAFAASGLIQR